MTPVSTGHFVEEADEGEESTAELCRHYGISRKTGYKWIERHASHGMAGLEEQSRAPHKQAQRASELGASEVEALA